MAKDNYRTLFGNSGRLGYLSEKMAGRPLHNGEVIVKYNKNNWECVACNQNIKEFCSS